MEKSNMISFDEEKIFTGHRIVHIAAAFGSWLRTRTVASQGGGDLSYCHIILSDVCGNAQYNERD